MSEEPAVVLDFGSATLKHGVAGAAAPHVMRTAAVRCRNERATHLGEQRCAATADARGVSAHDGGVLLNWRLAAALLAAGGAELAGRHVLLSEAPLAPARARRARAEALFEQLGAASLHVAPAAAWAGGGGGRAALVVDAGHAAVWCVPRVAGRTLDYAVRRVDVGGHLLSAYLADLLAARRVPLDFAGRERAVDRLRHRSCRVAPDFAAAMADVASLRATETLDGAAAAADDDDDDESAGAAEQVTLTHERVVVPELLFNPSNIGIQQAGVAEAAVQAITACPEPFHAELFSNIELIGGTSLTNGFADRVAAEVRALAPADVAVNVTLADDPITAAWHGGSALAQSPDIAKLRVTMAEYEERGLGHIAVDRKLFFESHK